MKKFITPLIVVNGFVLIYLYYSEYWTTNITPKDKFDFVMKFWYLYTSIIALCVYRLYYKIKK